MTPHQERPEMQAITVSDRDAGVAGLSLTDLPHPEAASERCRRAGTRREFHTHGADWPDTWTDRAGP